MNGYYTRWMDKALYDSGTTADGLRWAMNMTGANADHWGVEFDFVAKPLNWLDITGMFSWGDWRWGGVASGYLFDSQGQMLQNTRGDVVTDMAMQNSINIRLIWIMFLWVVRHRLQLL